jgi:hypothetical protein
LGLLSAVIKLGSILRFLKFAPLNLGFGTFALSKSSRRRGWEGKIARRRE